MRYIFTATFKVDGNKVYARVPDLPGCISSGKDLPDTISQITDAASNWLCVAEDEELTISDPTPQAMIIRDSEDVISLIQIDTTAYRAATENHIVRINVTLPAWMANLADKKGINCSQVLQESLLTKLDS